MTTRTCLSALCLLVSASTFAAEPLPRPDSDSPNVIYILVDLETDIGERTNLASRHPQLAAELKTLFGQARQ